MSLVEGDFIFMLKLLILIFALAMPAYAEKNFNVADLNASNDTDQLIIISVGENNETKLFMYEKNNADWIKILESIAYIGKKGLGKTREGDLKTPTGIFEFNKAFGIKDDPGCKAFEYVKVDDSHYWVGDSESEFYNKFVSTSDVENFNKKDSEHITDYKPAYNYALNINYNSECVPGKGSAIFLHCKTKNNFTGGCVSVPEDVMKKIIMSVKADCKIIIDYDKNISEY